MNNTLIGAVCPISSEPTSLTKNHHLSPLSFATQSMRAFQKPLKTVSYSIIRCLSFPAAKATKTSKHLCKHRLSLSEQRTIEFPMTLLCREKKIDVLGKICLCKHQWSFSRHRIERKYSCFNDCLADFFLPKNVSLLLIDDSLLLPILCFGRQTPSSLNMILDGSKKCRLTLFSYTLFTRWRWLSSS